MRWIQILWATIRYDHFSSTVNNKNINMCVEIQHEAIMIYGCARIHGNNDVCRTRKANEPAKSRGYNKKPVWYVIAH